MTLAIVGANGFIGRNCALSLQHLSPTLFAQSFDDFPFDLNDYSFKAQDLCDAVSEWSYLSSHETIVLLSNSARGHTQQNAISTFSSLCNALKTRSHSTQHIIFASSGGAIYGEASSPLSEKSALNPISSYGKAKMDIERLLQECSYNKNWTVTSLRIANPIGLWARKSAFVEAALHALRNDKTFELWADENYVRDYFCVEDLCHAIQLCIENKPMVSTTYNVGSGIGTSISDLLSMIEEVTGKRINIRKHAACDDDIQYNVLDCTKIKNELGWSAQRDIKINIQNMWESL